MYGLMLYWGNLFHPQVLHNITVYFLLWRFFLSTSISHFNFFPSSYFSEVYYLMFISSWPCKHITLKALLCGVFEMGDGGIQTQILATLIP